jgi:hypothetical protein
MRMFAATSPDDATPRTAVPAAMLRRLAFGRPQRGPIQPAPAPVAVSIEVAGQPVDDPLDLDQRVRQSGEW